MRLLNDETYAAIIKLLAQDEKVALFQKLLLCEKVEPAQIQQAEQKKPEVKK